MGRLLLIGIDALDAVQVEKLKDRLPNIQGLRETGYCAQFPSVWPPDSETAWSSIYTGWNPARHGVFQFVDPLQKATKFISTERDPSSIRGHTFWDIAGGAGKKVTVLFPHVSYPSWAVNGTMVTRASLTTDVSVTPAVLAEELDLSGLNAVKGMPGRQYDAYLEKNRRQVARQLELNLELIKRDDWDLFFTYWSALDLIQHQFWAHYDPADPSHQPGNPYQSAIPDFYELHDQVVGKLIDAVDDDVTVIVMSDHGHGMRPAKVFNINRLFRDHGLLTLKQGGATTSSSVLKRARKWALAVIGRYGLGNVAANVLKLMPWSKKIYMSVNNIDWGRTLACTTDMSGIKAYAYGGIQILEHNLAGRDYEEVRCEVIDLLGRAVDPENPGAPLFNWIKRREELYEGPYLDEYPDLVFELRSDYGAGWDAAGPLFDLSHSHSLYPGSHIQSNAMFIINGSRANAVGRAPGSMMDICPTVLDILGVTVALNMDGSTILDVQEQVTR